MRRVLAAALLFLGATGAPAQESPLPRVEAQTAIAPPPAECSAIIITAPRTDVVRAAETSPAASSDVVSVEPSLAEPIARVDQPTPLPDSFEAPPPSAAEAFARLAAVAHAGTHEDFREALASARASLERAPADARGRYRSALSAYEDLDRIFTYGVTEREGSFFNDQLLPGEYSRLVREYPGYRDYIEQYALTVSGTTLYPTTETRRFLADAASQRLERGGPIRTTPLPPLPAAERTSEVTTTPALRPAEPTTERDAVRPTVESRKAPATPAAKPRTAEATTKPAEPKTSTTADRTSRTDASSATRRPQPASRTSSERAIARRSAADSRSSAPAAADEPAVTSTALSTPSAATSPTAAPIAPGDQPLTPPSESSAAPDSTLTAAPVDTATTTGSSTAFERNVDEILEPQTAQPRGRSNLLLLVVAAAALLIFLLIYLLLRGGGKKDTFSSGKMLPTEKAGPPRAVPPRAAPPNQPPAKDVKKDESWVDDETKKWIDDVNKGKKKS